VKDFYLAFAEFNYYSMLDMPLLKLFFKTNNVDASFNEELRD